jgi:hypothetical protein
LVHPSQSNDWLISALGLNVYPILRQSPP